MPVIIIHGTNFPTLLPVYRRNKMQILFEIPFGKNGYFSQIYLVETMRVFHDALCKNDQK